MTSREINTKNIILSGNIEENDNDKILSSSASFTFTEAPQPISKFNGDTVHPKLLLNNLCTLSTVDSRNVQSQLAPDQYINIFNRYLVL